MGWFSTLVAVCLVLLSALLVTLAWETFVAKLSVVEDKNTQEWDGRVS